MRHPIQRLHVCAVTSRVYAAASNTLHVFDPRTGALLSSWSAPKSSGAAPTTGVAADTQEANDAETNPKKKRKVEEIDGAPAKSTGKDNKADKSRASLFSGTTTNNAITKILTTANGKYAVVATSEDKNVTVFSTLGGKLEVVSSRTLPKRIIDLALVDNDDTILCADKFGDVFGLPFFPPASDSETTEQTTGPSEVSTDDFKMDIEDKTFESEEQKQRYIEKQKAHVAREKAAAERRKRLQVEYNIPFAHDFILGHVSMLLCLSTVTLPADHPEAAGKEKTWILTGDRDEHIRVTRYPQSYVIDGFCLGHTQFVKSMLTPSWNPTSLISGGGDEFLLVWNWRQGKVLQKVDLVSPVQGVLGANTKIFVPQTGEKHEAEQVDDSVFKIAVSGIWELPAIQGVLVAVESVPAVFLFSFSYVSGALEYTSTLTANGNVLDVAVKTNNVLVAVDPKDENKPLVEEYSVDDQGHWAPVQGFAAVVSEKVGKAVDLDEALIAAVTPNVLYPVKSLRKEYGIRDREE
ncbi:hypothetical protein BZA77DRAFT_328557 [Pyronema omphalodes]|nr:hypothetical protein BZA77DRAFT_328557 [Pyronema omphalodes]